MKHKMSEHDPIKVLTGAYLQSVLNPYIMNDKKHNLYIDILHMMLDAAYSHGIETAQKAYQSTQFKLMEIPHSTDRVNEACKLLRKQRKDNESPQEMVRRKRKAQSFISSR